jgi:hypothetical protein
MKISDKIAQLKALDVEDPKTPKAWYSYEYFPPKTAAGKSHPIPNSNPIYLNPFRRRKPRR